VSGEWDNGVITLGYDSPAELEVRTAVVQPGVQGIGGRSVIGRW